MLNKLQISRFRSLKRTPGTQEQLIGERCLGDVLAHQKGEVVHDQVPIALNAQAIRRGFLSATTETSHQGEETSTDPCGHPRLVAIVPERTIAYASGAQQFTVSGIVKLRQGELAEGPVRPAPRSSMKMLHCPYRGEIQGMCLMCRFSSWKRSHRKKLLAPVSQ